MPLKNDCKGLLLPGERKSVEPVAARLASNNVRHFPQSDVRAVLVIVSHVFTSKPPEMAELTTVKDVHANLRHTNASTAVEHDIKSVPASVRVALESLDLLLKSKSGNDQAEKRIESN